MKNRSSFYVIILVFLVLTLSAGPAFAQANQPQLSNPVGNAFTYQGQLSRNGSPFSGSCNFTFGLYDAQTNGSQKGTSETIAGLAVTNGVFTAVLNDSGQFGSGAFDGSARWLDIAVQCPGDASPTSLGRQSITLAPYASYAITAGSVTGIVPIANGGTGSSTQNFVDLSTGQTIAGIKTFSNPPNFTTSSGAPFNVSSTNLVTSLNADRLDGYHASSLPDLTRALPPQNNLITALDSFGAAIDSRAYSSMTIGSDSFPIIAYFDFPNTGLKVAHCNDLACSTASLHTLGAGGAYAAIIIGSDGLPIISYLDNTNSLETAHCNDPICSSAALNPIDTGAGNNSIAIDSDGYPIISYYDSGNHLSSARCSALDCATIVKHHIDTTGDVGLYNSIAIGSDGFPLISYYDKTNLHLKVAHCNDNLCSAVSSQTIDSSTNVGQFTSIAIGSDGLPVISYLDVTNKTYKLAHCNDQVCTTAALRTIDTTSGPGQYLSSITIGSDGLPLIGYYDATNQHMKVAHCSDPTCLTVERNVVDASTGGGVLSSITIGSDGLPVMSYYDMSKRTLQVAHCSNSFCVPYQKLR